jgi:PAS domain S-box-containing protein
MLSRWPATSSAVSKREPLNGPDKGPFAAMDRSYCAPRWGGFPKKSPKSRFRPVARLPAPMNVYRTPQNLSFPQTPWSLIILGSRLEVDAPGLALAQKIAPDAPLQLLEALLPSVENSDVLQPFTLQVSDGADRTHSFEVLKLRPEANERLRFLLRDGAPQRTAAEAMARAQALIELSYEGFTIFDGQATILFESASNSRITGYPPDECVGRSLFDFIHPEDAGRLAPRFARLAERPGEMDSDTVRWRHRDGHWIYLEGTVVNQLGDPHIRGMINTFHDVTARVEMERALVVAKEAAEAVQAKQQRFLAMLSHELRTPLALIKQPLEALFPKEGGDVQWGIVARGLRRLEALVDELVDFTVLDAGQARLRVREVAVGDILGDWVAEMRPLAESREMRLVLEAGDSALRAFLDLGKFSKVVFNLLGNAVKFAPAGSTVVVRYRSVAGDDVGAAGMLEIEVEDAGAPIPEAARAQIFERFFQLESGDARGWDGMGLGLSLAAEMVALHGGEIGLRPAGPLGNCFWVKIPLGADHIALEELALDGEGESIPLPPLPVASFSIKTSAAASLASENGAGPMRLLIVEDHPDLMRYLALHLEPIYALEFASNGTEAIPLIAANPPDLIVSDVMMPGMDGVTLCRKVRETHTAEALPIILLSAKGSTDDRVEGLAAGANDYLGKPFVMGELINRLQLLAVGKRPAEKALHGSILRLQRVVEERLGEADFSIEAIARQIGLSIRQLQRLTREELGQSPGGLVNEIRLEKAKNLLRDAKHLNIAEIAAAVGLSPHYFNRLFRGMTGQTPLEFRGRGEKIEG